MKLSASFSSIVSLLVAFTLNEAMAAPLVIAHRGASGYLPEHTLASKALAYAMGADYLELDTVMTRDGVALVFHDLYLDATTNVASVYPGRARGDGRHYVIDFDYAEIRQLSVNERLDLEKGSARFPGRFPHRAGLFRVHSLADELTLIQGMNQATGQNMGIYIELKHPRWHRDNGHEIAIAVIEMLHTYGYRDNGDKVFIQSFDAAELRRIKSRDMTRLPLIQLIGENRWWPEAKTDFDFLKTPAGLKQIAAYAAGIGPWYRQILLDANDEGEIRFSALVENAHATGLVVHPYTLRADALPKFVSDFDQLLELLVKRQKVDGVFTDHPDRVRQFLARD